MKLQKEIRKLIGANNNQRQGQGRNKRKCIAAGMNDYISNQ
jgi:hypothetical protein